MGVSRRQFTREFKLPPYGGWKPGYRWPRRHGIGSQPERVAALAREFRQAPANAFPGQGERRWSEGKVAELERKIGQQAVERSIFCRDACSA
jgi:transposase